MNSRRTLRLLCAVLLAGAVLRAIGLSFGFPQFGARPDAYDSVPPEITAGLLRYELRQRVNALGPVVHVYDQQVG